MEIYYEFYDNGYHYKIYSNGTWKKAKRKSKFLFVINNFTPIIDELKAKLILIKGSMLPKNRFARTEYYKDLYKQGILK